MAFTLVDDRLIVARNAGALYGLAVGHDNMDEYAALLGTEPDVFLNAVYVWSVGSTSTSVVADVLITNLGITAAADMTVAHDYIVGVLDATPLEARGAAVNQILILFSGLTAEPWLTYATAWNQAVSNAVDYAAVPGNLDTSFAEGSITPISTFTLTVNADSITGTSDDDIVTGAFGEASNGDNTYNAGDIIDGGAGTGDDLNLIASGTTASSVAVIVRNIETINIVDAVGATFNAALIENAPAINFTNTQVGNESIVNDADLASVVGLAGKGNLTVNYLDASGSDDTALLSLNGVGTSSSVLSAIDVSNTSVEAVNITATGTNYASLDAGTTVTSLTLEGDGTNDLTVVTLGATATIDASTSTGANTFRIGNLLSTGDVITGGTGNDTLINEFTAATTRTVNVTGVETITLDGGTLLAGPIVNFNDITDLTTLNVMGDHVSSVRVSYDTTDGLSDLAVNLGEDGATVGLDMNSITVDDSNSLTINHVDDQAINVTEIEVTGDQAFVDINAGTSGLDIQRFSVDGSVGEINITVDAGGFLDMASGGTGVYSGFHTLGAGSDIGNINIDVDGNGNISAGFTTDDGGDIGDVTINLVGSKVEGDVNLFAYMYDGANGISGGNVGNVTLNVDGANGSGFASIYASGGDIGNITLTVNGLSASGAIDASAFAHADGGGDYGAGGNIGDITLDVQGDNANGSIAFNAYGGDVGNIVVNIDGTDASGGMSGFIQGWSGGGNGPAGNMGDITVTISGGGASWAGDFYLTSPPASSGGADRTVGDITVTLGDSTSGIIEFETSGAPVTIGNIDVTMADSAGFEFQFSGASGADLGTLNMGDITVTAGENDEFTLDFNSSGRFSDIGLITADFAGSGIFNLTQSSGYTSNIDGIDVSFGDGGEFSAYFADLHTGDIGDITADFGGSGDFSILSISGFDGSIGNITTTFGDNGSFDMHMASGMTGDIGDISATFGASGLFSLELNSGGGTNMRVGTTTLTFGEYGSGHFSISGGSGGFENIGLITLNGGDDNSVFSIDFSDTSETVIDAFDGIDGSTYLGYLNIDVRAVQSGTSITVGADGSYVMGTLGSDTITLGDGNDLVDFLSSGGLPTLTDEIFDFTKAEDDLEVGNLIAWAASNDVAADAATQAVDDQEAYVFADGSDGTGAEAIADYTDLDDVGTFLAAAFNDEAAADEFVAVINDLATDTSYAYFVDFDLGNAGGGAIDADAITLVGIVHANVALAAVDVTA